MTKTYHATLYGIGDKVFHFRLKGRKQPLKLNRNQYDLDHALAGRCFTLVQSNRGRWTIQSTDVQPHTSSGFEGVVKFANEHFGFLRTFEGDEMYFETQEDHSWHNGLAPGTLVSFDMVEYQKRRSAMNLQILEHPPAALEAEGRVHRFNPLKRSGSLILPSVSNEPLAFHLHQTDDDYRYSPNMILSVWYVETDVGVLVSSVSPIIESGTISFIKPEEGWGFIEMNAHDRRHFRYSALDSGVDRDNLRRGMTVLFTSKDAPKGLTAADIWQEA